MKPLLFHPKSVAALAVTLLSVASLQAADGFWKVPGGGNWPSAANWDSGVVANGADDTAYFGLGIFANIPASATFTLGAPRTIGHLVFVSSGPGNWSINAGGGSLKMDASLGVPSVTVMKPSQQVTINVPLTGSGGIEKLGDGVLVLAATNNYSGNTVLRRGELRVTGQIGSGGVTLAGGALTGNGVINGPVTVQPGATISLGGSHPSFGSSLLLQPGSVTKVDINAVDPAQSPPQALAQVNYGGTLVVNNLAGVPALGQTFQVFNASTVSGNFNSITPHPGPWLRWRFDPAGGVLSVVSSLSEPTIADASRVGNEVSFQIVDGPPGTVTSLLRSSNLAFPKSQWTSAAEGMFDVSGNCTLTDGDVPNLPQFFYIISSPALP